MTAGYTLLAEKSAPDHGDDVVALVTRFDEYRLLSVVGFQQADLHDVLTDSTDAPCRLYGADPSRVAVRHTFPK